MDPTPATFNIAVVPFIINSVPVWALDTWVFHLESDVLYWNWLTLLLYTTLDVFHPTASSAGWLGTISGSVSLSASLLIIGPYHPLI